MPDLVDADPALGEPLVPGLAVPPRRGRSTRHATRWPARSTTCSRAAPARRVLARDASHRRRTGRRRADRARARLVGRRASSARSCDVPPGGRRGTRMTRSRMLAVVIGRAHGGDASIAHRDRSRTAATTAEEHGARPPIPTTTTTWAPLPGVRHEHRVGRLRRRLRVRHPHGAGRLARTVDGHGPARADPAPGVRRPTRESARSS